MGGNGRPGVGARGLSYSLPVTYYELIPTAPVKYYCKILTVICARVLPASLTRNARGRASERANELRPGLEFLSRCPYPSGIYFVPARDSIVYSSSTARGERGELPEIKVLIRGFSRARARARGEARLQFTRRTRISIISRYFTTRPPRCKTSLYYNIVSENGRYHD